MMIDNYWRVVQFPVIIIFFTSVVSFNAIEMKKSIGKNDITNITADVIVIEDQTLQLKVAWKGKFLNNTKLDVKVIPEEGNHCVSKMCAIHDVPEDLGEILLPQDPMSLIVHNECRIQRGCSYNIELKTARRDAFANVSLEIPECFQNFCACNYPLPGPSISGEVINTNSINVTWIIRVPSDEKFNSIKNTVYFDSIDITIYDIRNTGTFLSGTPLPIQKTSLPLKSKEPLKIGQVIEGNNIFSFESTLLPESRFLIKSHIVDKNKCKGPEGRFMLIVPSTRIDSRQASETYNSSFLSFTVPTILLVLAAIFVANHVYKNFRKSHSRQNWRFIYRNAPSGNIHPISMEDNLLYTHKEITEAQEKGKADIYEISPQRITIIREIGGGAFGRVFKGTAQSLFRRPGMSIVAIKQLKKSPSNDEVEEFLGEIQTMKNVGRHENVVELLGCCTLQEPLMMIMEYVGQGDLLQYLSNVRKRHLAASRQLFSMNDGKSSLLFCNTDHNSQSNPLFAALQGKYLELRLSSNSMTSDASYMSQPEITPSTTVRPSVTETMYTMLSNNTNTSNGSNLPSASLDYILDNKELHNFAIQIAKGMRHLEEKGITHRDLAARNVLIDEHKTLKISDFGLSRRGIYINTRNRKLPLRWLSLEAIRDNLYSSKSDVWAFAVVLWEIGTLSGFPYPTISNEELLGYLISGKRMEKPEICTDALYSLMLKCWSEDPDDRPSFDDIVKWLQPQNQKIYVDFSTLGPDYVFPPTQEQVLENKSTLSTNNLRK